MTHCTECGKELYRRKIAVPTYGTHNTEGGECVWCGLPESSYGLKFAENADGRGFTLIGVGTCAEEEITVGTYNNAPVTAIASKAFDNCGTVKRIVINTGTECVIERNAFYSCKNLDTVIMSDGVSEIAERAFYECEALRLVTVPETVRVIGEKAFYSEYSDYDSVKLTIVCAAAEEGSDWSTDWNMYAVYGSSESPEYKTLYSAYYDEENGLWMTAL